jgi:peptidyl-dipeptidase Dcp
VRAGACLSSEAKEKVALLDQEISTLTTRFGQNVLGATNAYELFLSHVDVEGLPGPAKSAAAIAATEKGRDGEYFFNTNRSSFLPLLQFADRREVREEIFNAKAATATVGDFDNQRIAAKISALRAERAKILGFKSHSDYVLDDRMAKTPQNAKGLLENLWGPATKKAEEEASDLQERIRNDGGNFELKAWDWRYYAEKIKAERFDLDPDEVRQYFSLDNVRKGAFFVAEKLYGISFEPLTGVPLPHEDCSAWEVKDKTGAHVGIFIADFFARSSKRDGAWMSTFRDQSNLNGTMRPIVKNTCNFAKPVGEEPALLSFSNVRTLFHEFGHALHGLLSDVTYQSLSCTSVKWDFVELPSQIMEHWAMEPEVLRHYAKHAQTGEVIPDEIIKKLKAAATFNQGYETTGYLASSFLDLAWCSLETTQEKDTQKFESQTWSDLGLSDILTPAHRTTAFSHVFSGGYSAGYYSYIWAAVLDCDGYEAFSEKGIFDPETAAAFRDNVLSKGGTEEPMELYKKFRGREPSVDALLKNRGLD